MLIFALVFGSFWIVCDDHTAQTLTDHDAHAFMATLTAHNVAFEITAI